MPFFTHHQHTYIKSKWTPTVFDNLFIVSRYAYTKEPKGLCESRS
jgi:hypothetical protein